MEEAPAAPVVEEKSDIPAAGEDIFAEFEKKKQQILNFDIGEQPETERRSKFAGLKFGNDFNLMDDEDDDFNKNQSSLRPVVNGSQTLRVLICLRSFRLRSAFCCWGWTSGASRAITHLEGPVRYRRCRDFSILIFAQWQ